MKAVEIEISLESNGVETGPFVVRQFCDRVHNFSFTLADTATLYKSMTNAVGTLGTGKINLLCIVTDQTLALRVNGQTTDMPLQANGVYLLANFQGGDTQAITIKNASGATANISGFVGGFD